MIPMYITKLLGFNIFLQSYKGTPKPVNTIEIKAWIPFSDATNEEVRAKNSPEREGDGIGFAERFNTNADQGESLAGDFSSSLRPVKPAETPIARR